MNGNSLNIKGHSLRTEPLSGSVHLFLFLNEILQFSGLTLFAIDLMQLNLFFFKPYIGMVLLLGLVLIPVCRLTLRVTPLEYYLGLKKHGYLMGRLFYRPHQKPTTRQLGFIAFLSILIVSTSLVIALRTSPVLMNAQITTIDPNLAAQGDPRQEIPFFYLLGPWPKKFLTNDIFYQLSYNFGVPNQFVSKFTAIWSSPDIRVMFEGPKTLIPNVDPDLAARCFWDPISNSIWTNSLCEDLRSHHILKSIKDHHLGFIRESKLRWNKLPYNTQGLMWEFKALNGRWLRFTYFFNNGTTQTVTLILPILATQESEQAIKLFLETLANTKALLDLPTSRLWVSKLLSDIHFQDQKSVLTADIAKSQALLISKISIEPSSHESYFHFAGTSLLLLHRQNSPDENLPGRQIFKSSIQAALGFSRNISKKTGNRAITDQIEQIELDSKKY